MEVINSQFIVNKELIEEKRKTLQQTSIESDGWEINYIDEVSNEKWIEYRVEPEYHGGGYPVLITLPMPNTNNLIEITLQSNSLDEIAGASVFIYTNEEYDKIEFRDKLVTKLEKYFEERRGKLIEFDIKRLKTIIYETGLSDSANKKPVMGKHYTEIERDYKYYQENAERATRILNELKRSHQ